MTGLLPAYVVVPLSPSSQWSVAAFAQVLNALCEASWAAVGWVGAEPLLKTTKFDSEPVKEAAVPVPMSGVDAQPRCQYPFTVENADTEVWAWTGVRVSADIWTLVPA